MKLMYFILGACFGSFFAVIADRYRSSKDFRDGRSCCSNCKRLLSFFELIPIISFIFQRGTCRGCHHRIPLHLFLNEVIVGAYFTYFLCKETWPLNLLYLVIISLLHIASMIDWKHFEVPDTIQLVLFASAILLTHLQQLDWGQQLLQMIWILIIFILLSFLIKDGIGGADVKTFAILALFLSWTDLHFFILLTSLIAIAHFLINYLFSQNKMLAAIPLFPSIFLATFLILFQK